MSLSLYYARIIFFMRKAAEYVLSGINHLCLMLYSYIDQYSSKYAAPFN